MGSPHRIRNILCSFANDLKGSCNRPAEHFIPDKVLIHGRDGSDTCQIFDFIKDMLKGIPTHPSIKITSLSIRGRIWVSTPLTVRRSTFPLENIFKKIRDWLVPTYKNATYIVNLTEIWIDDPEC